MAEYAGIAPARAGSVSLFKDFGAATLSDASAQLVADLNSRGLLSRATTLRELQRRGIIEESVDIEAEIAAAEEEGPSLGELALATSGEAARMAAEVGLRDAAAIPRRLPRGHGAVAGCKRGHDPVRLALRHDGVQVGHGDPVRAAVGAVPEGGEAERGHCADGEPAVYHG